MATTLARRLAAEALGTALLVAFGVGSVVAALVVGEGQLAYAGLGAIALAFGLTVAVLIYAFGSTSGCHINPAVTVALAATGRFPWRGVGGYIAAQLLGAVAGALLIVGIFGTRAVEVAGLGQTALGDGVSVTQGLLAEVVGTFLLMLAIMALAVDTRAPVGWAGLMIGFTVTAVVMFVGPVSGASLNPARTFGPHLGAQLFGGSVSWGQLLVYVVGPVVGAVLGAFTYDFLARPGEAGDSEGAQGTSGEVVGHRT